MNKSTKKNVQKKKLDALPLHNTQLLVQFFILISLSFIVTPLC
jgi:hypothetical protein